MWNVENEWQGIGKGIRKYGMGKKKRKDILKENK